MAWLVRSDTDRELLGTQSLPGRRWTSPDFDDSKWKVGKAEFGFGGNQTTTVDAGPPEHRLITTYFRRAFDVADPTFYRSLVIRLKRDDGAAVYLNGREVHRANLPAGAVAARTLATRDVSGLEREVFFPVTIDPALLRRNTNLIAVEIHRNSTKSDGLTFDLELLANRADQGVPLDLSFLAPPNGALFQTGEVVPISIEAVDSGGKINAVSLYVDDQLVGTVERSPYAFRWTAARPGPHRLRAVAVDSDRKEATSFLTITVVENVPPTVTLSRPLDGATVRARTALSVSAQASDRGGTVRRVEFWVREADCFMSKNRLAATATKTPYVASISDLTPGHYMLWAVAVDDRDGTSQSMPVHIVVR